jgi:hypothetical protein
MTLIDRPRMQVLAGGRDITDRCDSITFSAVDRGGFEIATLGLPSADRPTKGTRITIRQGLEVAWDGRVAELVDHSVHGRATKTTGCEGWQALLKENPYQMIYVDRDLSQWHGPSVGRQIALTQGHYQQGSTNVASDQTENVPALIQQIQGDWAEPWKPIVDSWYDAGPGNAIAAIYHALSLLNAPGGTWQEFIKTCGDDQAGSVDSSVNLNTAGGGDTSYFNSTKGFRYANLVHVNEGTPGGGAGAVATAIWKNLAVYGTHGLTGRGDNPVGLYPSDIARHALAQVAGIQGGVFLDSTGYIAPHVVYRGPTDPADVINDMAKLMGWTWGVWEPATILGSEPRLDFRPPPTDATCVISKAECDELDITSRLGDLYDTCVVSYTDAGGTSGEVTVTVANPQLYEATGGKGRTLKLEGGLTDEAGARTLGLFALQLAQVASRGAGQATLPVAVRLANGASKPSCLLRPGIDRIRITDLVDGGPLLEQGTARRDVFRISRVETTVSKDGSPNTRVELDLGTNLLETLQARLALSAGVVGSGAVG